MELNLDYITDYLRRNAEQYSSKPAVIFEGKSLTWSELWHKVEALSGYFSEKLATDEQKVVDLLLTNSPEFVISYLAVLHAGHIVLPLDPAYKKLELDAIIKQIPPKVIVTSERYKDQISHSGIDILMVEKLLSSKFQPRKVLRLPPKKQIASLSFTSGTSGRPKAVPNTHANHIWNIKVCSEVWDWTHDDNLLISLPLSHWYGLVMGLAGIIYHGNTLYLQQQSFQPGETLDILSSGKVSIFTHVPLAYQQLVSYRSDRKYNLSRVRVCISGGAPLPPALWREFKKRFGVEIVETYGSSETGRIAANGLDQKMLGSPGKVLSGVNLKISQENEILIKSDGVFPGYFNNPEATRESVSKDGYWRTGDIGKLKDGYIYLKGRTQERIRRFSYTVSPRDVEWAMLQHPDVKDIHVMGRQKRGEPTDELIYFIVTSLSDNQIRDYCKVNLIFTWRPDKIIRLDELPRTRSGKTSLGKLKELAGQAA